MTGGAGINRAHLGLLHGANYFGGTLKSGKNLLDLLFDVALRKSQEDTVVILRPATNGAFRSIDTGLQETVDIGLGELSTCDTCVGTFNQLCEDDILHGKRSQIRLKDSEDILLSDEKVMNADGLVLGRGGVAQDADHGLADRSECRGVEEVITPVEKCDPFVLQVYNIVSSTSELVLSGDIPKPKKL